MKVHQNIIIDGVDYGERSDRKYSKFCNEGKWNNFIKPLLPEGDTLVEFGSNAGLFLKIARKDYRDVVGIDKSRKHCEMAKTYLQDTDCKVMNQSIREGWDFDQIPVADVVVLANYHYHILWQDWLYTLDQLKYKTRYCVVVSAKIGRGKEVHWKPRADINSIRLLFKDWEHINTIDNIPYIGDSHPRKMYSLLFRSELESVPIKDIWNPKGVRNNAAGAIKRKPKLFESLKKNGLIRPILIKHNKRIIDGGHRLVMLRELGYKNIIARYV